MSDFDFSDINLDFLQSTPPKRLQGNERISTPTIKTEFDLGPSAVAGKKIKSKKLTEWASKIAKADELIKEVKKLKCDKLELQAQLKNLQKSAVTIQNLYTTEKTASDLKSKEIKQLQESFEKADAELTCKNLQCDQLEGELAVHKERPVEYNVLVVKYLRLLNKLDEEESQRNFTDRLMVDNLRQYCAKYKLKTPPVSSSKPSKAKRVVKEDAAVQCDLLKDTPNEVKPTLKHQSTQCQTEMRSQGSQHISTMTTRGTTTACFIKYRTVGTSFPESQTFPVDEILREFAPWQNITPISPLIDQPTTSNRSGQGITKAYKSIGTCTWLCNIRRTIDFMPRNKQQRSQLARPSSSCDVASSQSIKQELATPSPSPTPNVQAPVTDNSNRIVTVPQNSTPATTSNQTIASNPFDALQTSLPLRQLPGTSFDGLWHIFGRMLLGLLQSSNAGIATNASTTNQEAVNQQQFYSWIRDLYETASGHNGPEQTEIPTAHNAATSPMNLHATDSPATLPPEHSEPMDTHSVATSPLHFNQTSPFGSPNIIRPQPRRSYVCDESENQEVMAQDVMPPNVHAPDILIDNPNCISNTTSTSVGESLSDNNLVRETPTPHEAPEKHRKKRKNLKILDEIQELFPEAKSCKSKRKALKRLLKTEKQKKKNKSFKSTTSDRTKSHQDSTVSNDIANNLEHAVEETAVDFLKGIFESSKDEIIPEVRDVNRLENSKYLWSNGRDRVSNEIPKTVKNTTAKNIHNCEEETGANSEGDSANQHARVNKIHKFNNTTDLNIDDSVNFKKPKNVTKFISFVKPGLGKKSKNSNKKELYTTLFGDSDTEPEDNEENPKATNVYQKDKVHFKTTDTIYEQPQKSCRLSELETSDEKNDDVNTSCKTYLSPMRHDNDDCQTIGFSDEECSEDDVVVAPNNSIKTNTSLTRHDNNDSQTMDFSDEECSEDDVVVASNNSLKTNLSPMRHDNNDCQNISFSDEECTEDAVVVAPNNSLKSDVSLTRHNNDSHTIELSDEECGENDVAVAPNNSLKTNLPLSQHDYNDCQTNGFSDEKCGENDVAVAPNNCLKTNLPLSQHDYNDSQTIGSSDEECGENNVVFASNKNSHNLLQIPETNVFITEADKSKIDSMSKNYSENTQFSDVDYNQCDMEICRIENTSNCTEKSKSNLSPTEKETTKQDNNSIRFIQNINTSDEEYSEVEMELSSLNEISKRNAGPPEMLKANLNDVNNSYGNRDDSFKGTFASSTFSLIGNRDNSEVVKNVNINSTYVAAENYLNDFEKDFELSSEDGDNEDTVTASALNKDVRKNGLECRTSSDLECDFEITTSKGECDKSLLNGYEKDFESSMEEDVNIVAQTTSSKINEVGTHKLFNASTQCKTSSGMENDIEMITVNVDYAETSTNVIQKDLELSSEDDDDIVAESTANVSKDVATKELYTQCVNQNGFGVINSNDNSQFINCNSKRRINSSYTTNDIDHEASETLKTDFHSKETKSSLLVAKCDVIDELQAESANNAYYAKYLPTSNKQNINTKALETDTTLSGIQYLPTSNKQNINTKALESGTTLSGSQFVKANDTYMVEYPADEVQSHTSNSDLVNSILNASTPSEKGETTADSSDVEISVIEISSDITSVEKTVCENELSVSEQPSSITSRQSGQRRAETTRNPYSDQGLSPQHMSSCYNTNKMQTAHCQSNSLQSANTIEQISKYLTDECNKSNDFSEICMLHLEKGRHEENKQGLSSENTNTAIKQKPKNKTINTNSANLMETLQTLNSSSSLSTNTENCFSKSGANLNYSELSNELQVSPQCVGDTFEKSTSNEEISVINKSASKITLEIENNDFTTSHDQSDIYDKADVSQDSIKQSNLSETQNPEQFSPPFQDNILVSDNTLQCYQIQSTENNSIDQLNTSNDIRVLTSNTSSKENLSDCLLPWVEDMLCDNNVTLKTTTLDEKRQFQETSTNIIKSPNVINENQSLQSFETEKKAETETPNYTTSALPKDSNVIPERSTLQFANGFNNTTFGKADAFDSSADEEISVINISTDNTSKDDEMRDTTTPNDELIIDDPAEESDDKDQELENSSLRYGIRKTNTVREISQQRPKLSTATNCEFRHSEQLDLTIENTIENLNNTNEISTLLNSTLCQDILSDSLAPLVDDLLCDDNLTMPSPNLDRKPKTRGRKRKSECQLEEQPPCKRSERLRARKNTLSIGPVEIGKYTRVNRITTINDQQKPKLAVKNLKKQEVTAMSTKEEDVEHQMPVVSMGFFREINDGITEEKSKDKSNPQLLPEEGKKEIIKEVKNSPEKCNKSEITLTKDACNSILLSAGSCCKQKHNNFDNDESAKNANKTPDAVIKETEAIPNNAVEMQHCSTTNVKQSPLNIDTSNNYSNSSLSPPRDVSTTHLRQSPFSIDTSNNYSDSPLSPPRDFSTTHLKQSPLNIDTSNNYSDSPLSPPLPRDEPQETPSNSVTPEIPLELSPQYRPKAQINSLLENLITHYSPAHFHRIVAAHSQNAGDKLTKREKIISTQYENALKGYCDSPMHLDPDIMASKIIITLQHFSIDYPLLCDVILKLAKNAEMSTVKEKELPTIIYEMPPHHLCSSLQRLFYLLKHLSNLYPTLCMDVLRKIDSTLFNVQQTEKMALHSSIHLIQLYLISSKLIEHRLSQHPARILIAKCLYFYALKSVPMIHEVLLWYPTALPPKEDRTYDRSDALITVIQQMLMSNKYDMDKTELRDKTLLSKLRFEYHYTPFKPSLDETISNLVEKLKMSKFCNLSMAFALLCKRMAPTRTENILQNILLPLANEYFNEALKSGTAFDARISVILDIISKIVKPLPSDTDVEVYLNLFSRFLSNFNRALIQESAVCAIIRLQRFGYVNCFQRLVTFKPTFELSPRTQAMLRTFIHRKPLSFLNTISNQSRVNFS